VKRPWLRLGARELLIAAQVTVSFALLVSATLFLRSLSEPPPGAMIPAAQALTVVPIELNTVTESTASRWPASCR
jgi:hypothetical protein